MSSAFPRRTVPLVVGARHGVERSDFGGEPVEEKEVRPKLLRDKLAEGQLLCARQIIEVVHLKVPCRQKQSHSQP